ncbi:class I SAM-dependent methyltransferase [Kitasatospora sp. NPDC002965]|uniref:class I SAM-dependent methyltransferase n=1 Tax=Kitasatospora sp. NPDC002965 TaxID=3154775 RepID=UPI0033ADE8EB
MTTPAAAEAAPAPAPASASDARAASAPPDFSGDVAAYYADYRRGYPPPVLDALRTAFALDAHPAIGDLALDLGCGTGQLALPLAAHVRTVIGMDPEPDMLRQARAAADRDGVHNALWLLGTDADVPALSALLPGRRPLGVTVIGNAIHWMRPDELFRTLRPLTRPGGGVAVIANGTPVWAQDTDWSRALRSVLEDHFGRPAATSCGTATDDRDRYARALAAAGFADVGETVLDYEDALTPDQLLGTVYSAIPAPELPAPADRPAFAARLLAALPEPGDRGYPEQVRVSVLTGRA